MIDLPSDLKQFCRQEEQRSKDTTLDQKRAVAISFYNGEPFGNEEDGLSQIVTRDVAEVVDHMAISVLGTIVSGDRVVEFQARSPEQVEQAAQATELVAWQFMRQQNGYRILHDWLKAGLLEKSGIVKTWAEKRSKTETYQVPAEMLGLVREEVEARGAEVVGGEPADEMGMVWDIAVREPLPVKFRDETVPNEEFRVSPDARCLQDAAYIAHVTRKSLSDLVAMGFDADAVSAVWDGGDDGGSLSQARDSGRGTYDNDAPREGMARTVWLTEEYPLWDLNGDGEAERLCIHRVGDTVLSIEEVEDHPFVLWTPFPMPHRLIGHSLADKVLDIQLIRSTITRQNIDGMMLANRPRAQIDENGIGDNTIDDYLTPGPGVLVRTKAGGEVKPFVDPFDVSRGLTMLEFMTGERESRTGITRLNQGLDADALNKTATGTALMQAQGQQIELFVARNYAEAVAQLFVKKLRLMRDHGGVMKVRIDGEFKEVDPSSMDDDMDLTVNVGLGSGRKDQRVQSRMMLLGIQEKAMASGLLSVDEEKIYNNVRGLVADTGLGNVNQYWNDPEAMKDEQGNMPERPNPAMAEAEAKATLEAERLRGEQEKAAANIEIEREKAQARIQIDREKAMLDAEIQRERAVFEAQLARDKADFEADLARERMAFEMEMVRSNAAVKAMNTAVPQNRPGGDLDK